MKYGKLKYFLSCWRFMKRFNQKYLKRIVDILEIIYEHSGCEAYLVGGAVRDFILDNFTSDFDVILPQKAFGVLNSRYFKNNFKIINQNSYLKFIKMCDKKSNLTIEFSAFRVEIYSNKNKYFKIPYFTNEVFQDRKRRDFTINSLYLNRFGKVLHCENDIKDLEIGIVRFVGEPYRRICEDKSRILRAIRFKLKYNFKWDKGTYDAVKENIDFIFDISRQKRREEFKKLLELRQDNTFKILNELGALKNMEALNLFDADNFIKKSKKTHNYIFYLAGLMITCEMSDSFLELVGINNSEKKKIHSIINLWKDWHENEFIVILKILKKYDLDFLEDFYFMCVDLNVIKKNSNSFIKIDKLREILHNIKEEMIPNSIRHLKISGLDLKKCGIYEGPQVGEVLDELFLFVLEGGVNERDILIQKAKDLRQEER